MTVHSGKDVLMASIADKFNELTGTRLPAVVQAELLPHYGDPNRKYHGLEHILEMLCEAINLAEILDLSPFLRRALGWSIIGHDVIYEHARPFGYNEDQSAEWTERTMFELNISHDLRIIVFESIRATKRHTMDGVPAEARVVAEALCDLDLHGLGKPPAEFDRSTERLWVEASSFTDTLERRVFDESCAAWATTLLGRPSIYHIRHYQCLLTDQAQENLRRLAGI